MSKNKLAIVPLLYLEPDYKQTLNDIMQAKNCGHDNIFFADRDGVGNMSRAFNATFKKYVLGKFEYVWFITNVRFSTAMPQILVDIMDDNPLAALHPCCPTSDHAHIREGQEGGLKVNVPFVELMAPIFRTELFAKAGMFPEECWYWYMDLAISYELRRQGYQLGVTNHVMVSHTYLRNSQPHPITEIRKSLREVMKQRGWDYMRQKYGADWKKLVGWEG